MLRVPAGSAHASTCAVERPVRGIVVLLAALLAVPWALVSGGGVAVAQQTVVTTPANGAEDVPTTLSQVTATFTPAVASETTVTVRRARDGSAVTGGSVTESQRDEDGRVTYTFSPALSLEDDTVYLLDFFLVGGGTSSLASSGFTTAAADPPAVPEDDDEEEVTTPTVVEAEQTAPTDNATSVSVSLPAITATFNQTIISASTLELSAGSEDIVGPDADVDGPAAQVTGRQVTYPLDSIDLERATQYTARFTVVAEGNLNRTITLRFTTEALREQSISLVPDQFTDAAVASSPLVVEASADSGLEVAFVSGNPSVCTITTRFAAGTTEAEIALLGAGTCSFTASQAGDEQWAAAPSLTRSFAVTAPPPAPGATLAVSPSTMAAGDVVAVTGTGWGAAEDVRLTIGPEGAVLGTATADLGGAIDDRFVVPDLPLGELRVTATGLTSGETASVLVTVVAATSAPGADGTGNGEVAAGDNGEATVADGEALAVTGWRLGLRYAALGVLLAIIGVALVRSSPRFALAPPVEGGAPHGWPRYDRRETTQAQRAAQRQAELAPLFGDVPGAQPVVGPVYITAADVARAAPDGATELVVPASANLTDLAREQVRARGLTVVRRG